MVKILAQVVKSFAVENGNQVVALSFTVITVIMITLKYAFLLLPWQLPFYPPI